MADPFEMNESDPFESQQPESRLSLFHLIGRHFLLLILGTVLGCAGGALYYARATPVYESSTQILVVNKSRNPLPMTDTTGSGGETDYSVDYLSTQLTLIGSPVIIGAAVRQAKLMELPSFAGGGDPTGAIISSLKLSQVVTGGKPTSVVNLSFRGSHAEDLPVVLTAVIESYQRFLKDRYQNVADETAKLIVEASTTLEQKLNRKQKEYDAFLAQLPTALWKGKEGFNSAQVQLMSLEAKRVDILNREAELKGRLQALEKALQDGRYSRAELLAMIAQAPGGKNGNENTSLLATERLMALELQEKNLLEDYGKDHPEVRLVRDQIALLRARVKRSDKDSKKDDSATLDPVESHVQALKLELEYIRKTADTLDKMLVKAHEEAKPLHSLEIKNESYRTDIARSQQLFDAIAKRLDEVSILKNVEGGYEAEIINPPGVGAKVAPKALSVFASALLLGLLLGVSLAYLAEISDQSFRTPEEIRRRLGLPVVGHIPLFAAGDMGKPLPVDGPQLDPILCTVYRPKSRDAEAIRGVRTALFFNRQGRHSLIQVTSPDKSDGKSTLSANLAVSIAQAEKKVILIDADFRRPRVHKLFNLSSEKGLASVMTGEAQLTDAIQSTPIPGLSVLPCGPIPSNPAELLTLPLFQEMLASLREKYDYVLIDTPPLLAVTDPCTVAPYVDGVLLTIRISKNARPNASRAKEILSTLGTRVIGVVVNGVRTDANGYGYGGYGYYYRYYHTYSNYGSDASSSSDAEREAGMHSDGGVDMPRRKLSVSRHASRKKTGFFTWLFGL